MTVRLNEDSSTRGRVASYVWGPHIGSGYGAYVRGQAAGSVGGLCLVLDGAITDTTYPANNTASDPADDDYFPLTDRLGNITAYRKAAPDEPAAALSAEYDYDAFGQELRSVGPGSNKMPYRFSTKYTERGTGLVYYSYCWHDAQKGWWLSRDPIEERGGMNLIAFLSIEGGELRGQTGLEGSPRHPL
jgi:RHS repeat-associated protein